MFRIKICGITRAEDAIAAKNAGADAIGLNYYERSKRFLAAGPAKAELLANIPAGLARVGVFVNFSAAEILQIVKSDSLDWIQLHGDEPPWLLAELRKTAASDQSLGIIRAFPFAMDVPALISDYLNECSNLDCSPDAILIDSPAPVGEFGGTGNTVDWQRLAFQRSMLGKLPLILAGGLTPQNVSLAIRTVHPDAVDTASGVESSPGIKDNGRLWAFCQAAANAFGR